MMKKCFTFLAALCLLSAPVSLTSCDDDDVQQVMNIIDLVLGQGDVVGSWAASAQAEDGTTLTFSFTFQQNGQGAIVVTQGTEVAQFNFTYTLSNNVITMQGEDVQRLFERTPYTFTVSSVTQQQLAMTDADGSQWVLNRVQ